MSKTRKDILAQQIKAAEVILSVFDTIEPACSNLFLYTSRSEYIDNKLRNIVLGFYADKRASVIAAKEQLELLHEAYNIEHGQ